MRNELELAAVLATLDVGDSVMVLVPMSEEEAREAERATQFSITWDDTES